MAVVRLLGHDPVTLLLSVGLKGLLLSCYINILLIMSVSVSTNMRDEQT